HLRRGSAGGHGGDRSGGSGEWRHTAVWRSPDRGRSGHGRPTTASGARSRRRSDDRGAAPRHRRPDRSTRDPGDDMTRPTAEPLPASPPTATPWGSDGRLAGVALLAGCLVTTLGFLGVGFVVRAAGDARYTDPLWQPLYGVVLTGSVLVVLGLPA